MIYPVVSVGIRSPLVHVVEALASRSQSLFRGSFWLATKALAKSPVTSMPSPLRSFSMKEGDLHVPRIKPSSPLHTKPEGQWLADEPPKLQGAGTPRYNLWFTQEPAHEAAMACSLTLSRANSSTNTLKVCGKPKDVINKLLGGFENFSSECG
jgi:hypothetical protein